MYCVSLSRKPTTFATCVFEGKKKLVLGLPGNPVSATVTSHLYVLPALRKMSGHISPLGTIIKATVSIFKYLKNKLMVLSYKQKCFITSDGNYSHVSCIPCSCMSSSFGCCQTHFQYKLKLP